MTFSTFDPNEPAPYVLTEADLPALVDAIYAEGYRIIMDTDTGKITLEKRKEEGQ